MKAECRENQLLSFPVGPSLYLSFPVGPLLVGRRHMTGEYQKYNPSSSCTVNQYYTLKFYTSSISTISDEIPVLNQTVLHSNILYHFQRIGT